MIPRLRHDLRLRNDGSYVVAYPRDTGEAGGATSGFGWRILHPNQAILLSLLDRARTLDEATRNLATLIGQSVERTRLLVDAFCAEQQEILEKSDRVASGGRPLDPHDFLTPASRVDLSVSRLNNPTSCVWVVTLACPFRCRYCYADLGSGVGTSPPMGLPDALRVIDALRASAIGTVTVSGGDPFLHPQALRLLEGFARAGYHPEVPTKTPLERRVLGELREMGYPSIQFSVDTLTDPTVIEEHLGIDGADYLSRMRASIAAAGSIGLRVAVNAVVTSRNAGRATELIEACGRFGFVYRLGLSPMGASIYRMAPDLLPPASAREGLEAAVAEGRARYPWMRIQMAWLPHPTEMDREERARWYRNRARCSAGRSSFVVLPDGRMGLCEELYYHPAFILGSLLDHSIPELWNSPRMRRILYPPQEMIRHGPCASCAEYDGCVKERGRCWRRAIKAYRDRIDPHNWPDPFCPHAPPSPNWGT